MPRPFFLNLLFGRDVKQQRKGEGAVDIYFNARERQGNIPKIFLGPDCILEFNNRFLARRVTEDPDTSIRGEYQ